MQNVVEKINLRIKNSQKFIVAVRKIIENKELVLEERPSFFKSIQRSDEEVEQDKEKNAKQ